MPADDERRLLIRRRSNCGLATVECRQATDVIVLNCEDDQTAAWPGHTLDKWRKPMWKRLDNNDGRVPADDERRLLIRSEIPSSSFNFKFLTSACFRNYFNFLHLQIHSTSCIDSFVASFFLAWLSQIGECGIKRVWKPRKYYLHNRINYRSQTAPDNILYKSQRHRRVAQQSLTNPRDTLHNGKQNKNSSGDEIANVNVLRQYRTYFKILKKRTYFI